MAQQTAIEKMIESLNYWDIKIDCPNLFEAICNQAKEKEKEQLKQKFLEGMEHERKMSKNKNWYNNFLKSKQ